MLKVGDKVKVIKDDSIVGSYDVDSGIFFNPDMDKFIGATIIIDEIHQPDNYIPQVWYTANGWSFASSWLIGINQEVGTKVNLTSGTKGTVINHSTLAVETKQSVGGSGARNMIIWALKAHNLGYSNLTVHAPMANSDAKYNLAQAEDSANELLKPHGLSVKVVNTKLGK